MIILVDIRPSYRVEYMDDLAMAALILPPLLITLVFIIAVLLRPKFPWFLCCSCVTIHLICIFMSGMFNPVLGIEYIMYLIMSFILTVGIMSIMIFTTASIRRWYRIKNNQFRPTQDPLE